jgi:hypothetical protein
VGREHDAEVVGCEPNRMFRIESMVQRLQIMCTMGCLLAESMVQSLRVLRRMGFYGKEHGAKVTGCEKNEVLQAKSRVPRLRDVRRVGFYEQRAGCQGCWL